MADNVNFTPGSGAAVTTDQAADLSHMQIVKLAISADADKTPIPATVANGILADVSRVVGNVTVVQPVAASLKVEAVMAAGSAVVPVNDSGGSLTVDSPQLPAALVGGRLDVVIGAGSVTAVDGGASLTVDSPQLPAALTGAGSIKAALVEALPAGTALIGAMRVQDGAGAPLATVTAGNALKVDGSAATQPVSGTVTANQGTAASTANAHPVKVSDGTDTVGISTVSGAKALKVDVIQSVGFALADKGAFVEGTTKFDVVGGVFNETISADPTEDQAAAARITAKRALHVNLRNVAGTEIGTAGSPVRTDPTGVTTQPVLANQGTANATPWNENLSQVAGVAVVVASAGVQKVGVVDEAGAAFSETNPLPVRQTYSEQTRFKNAVTYSASQSDIAIFTPTGGKRFVICGITISPTATGVVKVFDDTNVATNMYFQGTPGGTTPFAITFTPPAPSEAVNQVLRYSTGAAATGDITVYGYEV